MTNVQCSRGHRRLSALAATISAGDARADYRCSLLNEMKTRRKRGITPSRGKDSSKRGQRRAQAMSTRGITRWHLGSRSFSSCGSPKRVTSINAQWKGRFPAIDQRRKTSLAKIYDTLRYHQGPVHPIITVRRRTADNRGAGGILLGRGNVGNSPGLHILS